MKQCRECGVTQSSSNFYIGRRVCNDCRRKADRSKYEQKHPDAGTAKGKRPPSFYITNGELSRQCSGCGMVKAVDMFRPDPSRPNVPYARFCKPCETKKSNKWVKNNSHRHNQIVRQSQRKSMYGIANDSVFLDILKDQEWLCANKGCLRELDLTTARKYAIDHNHKTGEFRGILCPQCNFALGQLSDDPDKIIGLLRYCRNGDHIA